MTTFPFQMLLQIRAESIIVQQCVIDCLGTKPSLFALTLTTSDIFVQLVCHAKLGRNRVVTSQLKGAFPRLRN